jgi:hypothetical protein
MFHIPSPHRLVAALVVALAAGLTTASSAGAQAVATATPNVAGGKGTRVSWAVDGLMPPVAGRVPSSLVMVAPAFGLDRRAVAKRCRKAQATLDECPKSSRIGSALMTIIVHRPNGTINELPIEITLYHGRRKSVLAVAFLVGTRVVPGKLERTDAGVVLTFDPLPAPEGHQAGRASWSQEAADRPLQPRPHAGGLRRGRMGGDGDAQLPGYDERSAERAHGMRRPMRAPYAGFLSTNRRYVPSPLARLS